VLWDFAVGRRASRVWTLARRAHAAPAQPQLPPLSREGPGRRGRGSTSVRPRPQRTLPRWGGVDLRKLDRRDGRPLVDQRCDDELFLTLIGRGVHRAPFSTLLTYAIWRWPQPKYAAHLVVGRSTRIAASNGADWRNLWPRTRRTAKAGYRDYSGPKLTERWQDNRGLEGHMAWARGDDNE